MTKAAKKSQFQVGDEVEVNFGGCWYLGRIVAIKRRSGGQLYHVESPDYPGDEFRVWSGDYPASELRRPKP